MLKRYAALLTVLAVLLSMVIISCGNDPFFHHVKVIVNGKTMNEELIYDADSFVFPEMNDSGLIFEGWRVDGDSNLYHPGDSVKIFRDTTVSAVLRAGSPIISLPRENGKMGTNEILVITAPEEADVYYTTDGSAPSDANGIHGTEVNLKNLGTGTWTVRAVVISEGVSSDIVQKTIEVVTPPDAPSITEDTTAILSHGSSLTVSSSSGRTMYYTTDGTDPGTENGKSIENSSISLSGLSGKLTLKLISYSEDGVPSDVDSVALSIRPSEPTYQSSMKDGKITESGVITLTPPEGSVIRYTMDDDSVSAASGTEETEISIKEKCNIGSHTLRIISVRDGIASETVTVNFTVIPNPFDFTSSDGAKVEENAEIAQKALISTTAQDGSDIYYTTDGKTNPTRSSSKADNGKIKVTGLAGRVEIRAIAVKNGVESEVVTLVVLVNPPAPDRTSIIDGTKYLKSEDRVTGMTSPASGTTLRYEFGADSTPVKDSAEVPSDGISLTSQNAGDVVIKVVAEKDGVISEATEIKVVACDYRLTFASSSEVLFNTGDAIAMPEEDSTSASMFDGWYTQENGGGDGYYEPGKTYRFSVRKSMTLYAHRIEGSFSFEEVKSDDGKTVIGYAVSCGAGDYEDTARASYPSSGTKVKIPAVWHGKKVIAIAENGFRNCTKITDVTFEKSENITKIGSSAFEGAAGLVNITVPENVTEIGNGAFAKTAIETVTVPSKVTSLGERAFENCSDVSSAEINSTGLSELPQNTFCRCTSLTSVKLSDTITSIGSNAFAECTDLQSGGINLGKITEIGYQAFHKDTALTELNLESAETIDDNAFQGCTGLTKAELAKVRTIAEKAFDGCSSLGEVNIGSDIVTIGDNAFNGTSADIEIYINKKSDDKTAPTGSTWGSQEGSVFWKTDYRLTFDLNGGKGDAAVIRTDANVKFILPTVTLDGCTLDGWYDGEKYLGAGGEEISMEKPTADTVQKITLRANWITGSFGFEEVKSADGKTVLGYAVSCGITGTEEADRKNYPAGTSTTITIPAMYQGKKVIAVAENGFMNCTKLTGVTFENPDSITSIGKNAFYYATSLKDMTIPGKVKEIGDKAFYWTAIESVTVPLTVTDLGRGVFKQCMSLKSAEIKSRIKELPDETFFYCSNLTSVTLPETLEIIGEAALAHCDNLTFSGISPNLDNVKKIGYSAFAYDSALTEISLPSVETIDDLTGDRGSWAFLDCTGLTKVDIPKVRTVGSLAFEGCSALRTVRIGSDVEVIGDGAFTKCTGLETVSINRKQKNTTLDPAKWSITDTTGADNSAKVVQWHKDFTMSFFDSDGTTKLGTVRFDEGDDITLISPVKEGYTLDGWYTDAATTEFYAGGNEVISSIESPGEVGTDVRRYAKWIKGSFTFTPVKDSDGNLTGYCVKCSRAQHKAGEKITIPSTYRGVKVIEVADSAFLECRNLTEIDFEEPSNIRRIGDQAFGLCTGLVKFTFPESVEELGINMFYGCSGLNTVVFPLSFKPTELPKGMFTGTSSLASVSIPGSIKVIGNEAFVSSGLTTISIPDSVETIGEQAFAGCTKLTSVEFDRDNNSIRTIGDYAFMESGLRSFTVPAKVTEIGKGVFEGCSGLESVGIPSGVTKIGEASFKQTGLKSVDIPDTVVSIGDQAFYYCQSLESVTIGSGIRTISERMDYTYDEYGNVTGSTPSGEYDTFRGCTNLKTITIKLDSSQGASLSGCDSKWGATEAQVIWNDTVMVIFNSDGGSKVDSQYPDERGRIKAPVPPTKSGYYFAGWFSDGATDVFDFDNETVMANLTLKAKWVTSFNIGDRGPGGGYIVYDLDADNNAVRSWYNDELTSAQTGWRYIEAAPEDLSGTYVYGYYKTPYVKTYSGETRKTSNPIGLSTHTEMNKGKSNTELAVNKMGDSTYLKSEIYDDTKTTSYAAKACLEYSCNGYGGWFISSYREMERMLLNLKNNKLEIGLTHGKYMTSTQKSDIYVYYGVVSKYSWNTFPTYDSQWSYYCNKGDYIKVRPIRYI